MADKDFPVEKLVSQSKRFIKEISAKVKPSLVKIHAWVFHKLWRKMYEKVVVDEAALT
jgi:hypothetical protein